MCHDLVCVLLSLSVCPPACGLLVLQLPHSQHESGKQEPFCLVFEGLLFNPQSPAMVAPEQLLHPTTVPNPDHRHMGLPAPRKKASPLLVSPWYLAYPGAQAAKKLALVNT